MNKEKKIEILSGAVIFGFFISVAICYVYGYYLNSGYPYNTFLFIPDVKFSDFISEVNLASNLNPYSNENGIVKAVYYPFSYLIFYIFSFFGVYSLLVSSILFSILFAVTAYIYLNPVDFRSYKNIFFMMFLSYPFLFELDRANIEWMVFLFTGCFLYFYHKGEENLSLVFLSMAVSMKFYPIIFMTIFLLDKKYTLILKGIVLVFLITFVSLYSFSGEIGETYRNLLEGQKYFKDTYILSTSGGLAYNSSLFGILKGACVSTKTFITVEDLEFLSLIYFFVVIALYIGLIVFMLRKKLKKWEIVTIITFSMILFPYVSFDYKLLFVFIPIFYYLCEESNSDLDYIIIVLFSLLLIPKNFYFLFSNISISVVLNPLAMLLLVFIIVWNNSKNTRVSA